MRLGKKIEGREKSVANRLLSNTKYIIFLFWWFSTFYSQSNVHPLNFSHQSILYQVENAYVCSNIVVSECDMIKNQFVHVIVKFNTYSVNADIRMITLKLKRSSFSESLPELMLADIKCCQFSTEFVALLSLQWGHVLLHHYRLLLHIIPGLWKLLWTEKRKLSMVYILGDLGSNLKICCTNTVLITT
jgi:hypothetical protein